MTSPIIECCFGVGWIFDGDNDHDADDDLDEIVCYWCQGERLVDRATVDEFNRAMGEGEPKAPCKHCRTPIRDRAARGLCQRCFRNRSIRRKYPKLTAVA